jgi:cytidyltransferase-like protein
MDERIAGRRIGIYGGTFDPIHVGHLVAASEVHAALALDRVVFMPAGRPPHKRAQAITPVAHRVRMIELAIAGRPALGLSTLDLTADAASYTVDLLARARDAWGAAVEAVGDVLLHRARHLIGDRAAGGDAGAQVARGDVELGHRDAVDAPGQLRDGADDAVEIDVDVRAGDDGELGQFGDAPRRVPGREIAQRVLAHDEEALDPGAPGVAGAGEQIDGVGSGPGGQVEGGEAEEGPPGDR